MNRLFLAASLALVIAGCGAGQPEPASGSDAVRALCALADLPVATAAERTTLYNEADRRFAALKSFPNRKADRDIVDAVMKVATSRGTEAVRSGPSPFPSSFLKGYSVEDAQAGLKQACSK